jgi:hypothetical protein
VDAERRMTNVPVSEPDMDMNRTLTPVAWLRRRRLIAALVWFRPSLHMIESPRRSVDRELQEYSPTWQ